MNYKYHRRIGRNKFNLLNRLLIAKGIQTAGNNSEVLDRQIKKIIQQLKSM
jgi:hypothetical protein